MGSTKKGGDTTTNKDAVPADTATIPTPSSPYEPAHLLQMMLAVQKDVTALSTKNDRLISDVEKLDGKVNTLTHTFSLIKGASIAACALISVIGVILWWVFGAQITELKNKTPQQAEQGISADLQGIQNRDTKFPQRLHKIEKTTE